jgi:hypothetical protein
MSGKLNAGLRDVDDPETGLTLASCVSRGRLNSKLDARSEEDQPQ